MKKLFRWMLIVAIVLIPIVSLSSCTHKAGIVQIEVTHPITGEILKDHDVIILESIPENTPIEVKVKDLKTGKYLKNGDLTSGRSLNACLSYSVSTPTSNGYRGPNKIWPTGIGNNGILISFESETIYSSAPDKRQYKPAMFRIEVEITGKTNDTTAETTNVK